MYYTFFTTKNVTDFHDFYRFVNIQTLTFFFFFCRLLVKCMYEKLCIKYLRLFVNPKLFYRHFTKKKKKTLLT
jgi:hypothetical protein